MSQDENSKQRWRFQFSLRSLLIFTTLFALVFPFRHDILQWILEHDYLPRVLALVVAFVFGRRIGPGAESFRSSRRLRLMTCAATVSAFSLLAFALFTRHRWLAEPLGQLGFPQDWPYPDKLLLAIHDWIDARRPTSPGYFKIHGEFYTVLAIFNAFVVLAVSAAGVTLGFATAPFKFRLKKIGEETIER